MGKPLNIVGTLIFGSMLAACSTSSPAADHDLVPPSPPAIIDPNSEEFRQQFAAEREAERQKALQSNPVVTRQFYVRWEMHYGFYLEPLDGEETGIFPDFPDRKVYADFSRQFHAATASHLGQTLLCECTGVAWDFYSNEQFEIQAYELTSTE